MNIRKFSPGDRITRSEPAIFRRSVHNSMLGIDESSEELIFDEIGDELTLIRFEHNCAYLATFEGLLKLNLHPDFHTDWSEGWEYFKAEEWSDKYGEEESVLPQKTYTSWFKAGLILSGIAMFVICFSDISAAFFYSYLAVFFASLLSFVVYITKTDQ